MRPLRNVTWYCMRKRVYVKRNCQLGPLPTQFQRFPYAEPPLTVSSEWLNGLRRFVVIVKRSGCNHNGDGGLPEIGVYPLRAANTGLYHAHRPCILCPFSPYDLRPFYSTTIPLKAVHLTLPLIFISCYPLGNTIYTK